MGRGKQTRAYIVEQAAALFNQKGFAGASVSDIMTATGLKKGGIYRHFESKEALAGAAFDYAIQRMSDRFVAALEGKEGTGERLRAIIGVYAQLVTDPPIPGGSPILNAGVEHDDGNPELRKRVRTAMYGLRRLLRNTLRRGIDRGEVTPSVDADAVASLIAGAMEGGVLLSRLSGDPAPMRDIVAQLSRFLDLAVLTSKGR